MFPVPLHTGFISINEGRRLHVFQSAVWNHKQVVSAYTNICTWTCVFFCKACRLDTAAMIIFRIDVIDHNMVALCWQIFSSFLHGNCYRLKPGTLKHHQALASWFVFSSPEKLCCIWASKRLRKSYLHECNYATCNWKGFVTGLKGLCNLWSANHFGLPGFWAALSVPSKTDEEPTFWDKSLVKLREMHLPSCA